MANFLRLVLSVTLLFVPLFLETGTASGEPSGPKQLTVAHSSKYPPFSYLDEQGKPRGYLIDMWTAFGRSTGTEVSFRLGTWQESLEMVRNGVADVHGGLFYNRKRDAFLDYGPTITQIDTILFQHRSLTSTQAELEPVAVVRGGFAAHHMKENHPDVPLLFFDTSWDSILAAKEGKIKRVISDAPTGIFFLRKFDMEDQFLAEKTLYSMDLRAAVTDGDTRTLESIQKGWIKLDSTLCKHIKSKWFIMESTYPDWIIPAILIALAGLGGAILFRVYIAKSHD